MNHERPQLFIDGAFRGGSGTVDVINPATATRLGIAATGGASDIDAAVAASRRALPGWSTTSPQERSSVLRRMVQTLMSRAEETAKLCSQENGTPIAISTGANGFAPSAILGMYADVAQDLSWTEDRPSGAGSTTVRRVPVGVVAAISPWNYPQTLAMMKIAPALAAGCTVVFKAATETALDAFVFADAALDAGLPQGVLNVIPAEVEASRYLVAHPGIDKVAFTGSTPAGRDIAEVCGRLLRPVTLELGGKSAGLVLDDVDLEVLASSLYETSFANNGMTCHASTRILVPESRYDEVADTVASVARSLKVGDPLEPDTLIGPMVTSRHQQRVKDYIGIGMSSGAKLLAGGGTPDGSAGYFIEPTVFGDVDNTDVIAREEIFGPVLSLIKYGTEDDAVAIANDSDYGLGGVVWSADLDRADNVAQRIETGTIGINSYILDPGAPFGGVKASGYGRELGPEGIDPYLTYQSVYHTAGPGRE